MAIKRPNLSTLAELAEEAPETATEAPAATPARTYPGKTRTTLYLPEAVHEAIRRVAFDHRIKPHDVIMQGIDLVLQTKYGMPGVEKPTSTKKR